VVVPRRLLNDVGFVTRGHDAHVGFAFPWAIFSGVELNMQLGVGVVYIAV
jgi:hypothetical protein